MGLFDRFKKQKWENKNPEVRLEAIKELNDQNILVELAKNDSDAKHYSARAAAVERIDDEDFLIDVIENDCNTGVVVKEAFHKLQKMETLSDETLKKIKEMTNHEVYDIRNFANKFIENDRNY